MGRVGQADGWIKCRGVRWGWFDIRGSESKNERDRERERQTDGQRWRYGPVVIACDGIAITSSAEK